MKNRYKKLDGMYSEIIRRRAIKRKGGCEYCGSQKYDQPREDGSTFPSWKTLQCSHGIGRSNIKVRFDMSNGWGLCGCCHMKLEHNPILHDEFILAELGQEEYDLLKSRASRGYQKLDMALIELYLKAKIEELLNCGVEYDRH